MHIYCHTCTSIWNIYEIKKDNAHLCVWLMRVYYQKTACWGPWPRLQCPLRSRPPKRTPLAATEAGADPSSDGHHWSLNHGLINNIVTPLIIMSKTKVEWPFKLWLLAIILASWIVQWIIQWMVGLCRSPCASHTSWVCPFNWPWGCHRSCEGPRVLGLMGLHFGLGGAAMAHKPWDTTSRLCCYKGLLYMNYRASTCE